MLNRTVYEMCKDHIDRMRKKLEQDLGPQFRGDIWEQEFSWKPYETKHELINKVTFSANYLHRLFRKRSTP